MVSVLFEERWPPRVGEGQGLAANALSRRLEPANALLALLPYSNFVRQLGPSAGIQRIQPLADRVPAFDLGRGGLADMIQGVERLVASPIS